jgi:hypothetical protein
VALVSGNQSRACLRAGLARFDFMRVTLEYRGANDEWVPRAEAETPASIGCGLALMIWCSGVL